MLQQILIFNTKALHQSGDNWVHNYYKLYKNTNNFESITQARLFRIKEIRAFSLILAPLILCNFLVIANNIELLNINSNSGSFTVNNSLLLLITKNFKKFKFIILICFSLMVLFTVYFSNNIILFYYFSFCFNINFYKYLLIFYNIYVLFYYIIRLFIFIILILEAKYKVQYLPKFMNNWFSNIKEIIKLEDYPFYIKFFLIIIPLFFFSLCYFTYIFIL